MVEGGEPERSAIPFRRASMHLLRCFWPTMSRLACAGKGSLDRMATLQRGLEYRVAIIHRLIPELTTRQVDDEGIENGRYVWPGSSHPSVLRRSSAATAFPTASQVGKL